MTSVESILVRYRGPLARVVASYTAPGADREDLAQEIRLALVKAWPRFRGEGSERAYVFRIAHNVALHHVHRRKRRRWEIIGEEQVADARPGPETTAAARQEAERLFAAVRGLRAPYRQVAMLALEGLQPREIGEVLGLTANAAGVRLHRAKHLLAKTLEETKHER